MDPSPIDLTTLVAVKSWLSANGLPASGTADDDNIQACITAASMYWLWRTGRGSANGTVPATSPLVVPVAYNETYNGNGTQQMFVRNAPIVSVQSLIVNGVAVPASTGYGSPGYSIADDGNSLYILSRFVRLTSTCYGGFAKGLQNVNVQYTAGFAGTPADIELACRQMVALNYKRRQWIDQKSQAMAQGAGTISFRDWEFPPAVESVMRAYTRVAVV